MNQKLHDIATSGPVVLTPDFARLTVVGLTLDVAGGKTARRPFLMILNWIRVSDEWKIASEIILPVPPAPAVLVRSNGRPPATMSTRRVASG